MEETERKKKKERKLRKERRSDMQGKRLSFLTTVEGHAEREIVSNKRGGPNDSTKDFFSFFNLATRALEIISPPVNRSLTFIVQ